MLTYKFVVMNCDEPTKTGLTYPKSEMLKVFNELNTKIESKLLFVTLDAFSSRGGYIPDMTRVDLSLVCGFVNRIEFEGNALLVEVRFMPKSLDRLDHPSNVALGMLEDNITSLKLNPIGMGNLNENKVVSNYSLTCFNLVPNV